MPAVLLVTESLAYLLRIEILRYLRQVRCRSGLSCWRPRLLHTCVQSRLTAD
jgi:hypothetical protein